MSRFPALLLLLSTPWFGACAAPPSGEASDDPVAVVADPIMFGSVDTTHSGVVMVLSSTLQCSGAIVRLKADGTGYVLTAAHCCAGPVSSVPTTLIVGQDAASPSATRYRVNAGSVFYDAAFAGVGSPFDFCMMTFAGAAAGTQVLALPSAAGDGLSMGAAVEHVGYGITAPPVDLSNARRFHGSDVVDLPAVAGGVTFANQFTYSMGGPGNTPGTCPGDSGGPSLFPAGASPASQVIVGVQSYGGPSTASCGTYTFGGDSRVSSRIGTGRFISTYVADGSMTGVGVRAAMPVPAMPKAALTLLAAILVAPGAGMLRRRRRAVTGAAASPAA